MKTTLLLGMASCRQPLLYGDLSVYNASVGNSNPVNQGRTAGSDVSVGSGSDLNGLLDNAGNANAGLFFREAFSEAPPEQDCKKPPYSFFSPHRIPFLNLLTE